jgi:uncharacterized MnhB-related membrane protein
MKNAELVALLFCAFFIFCGCYSFFEREQVMSAIFWALCAVVFALLFDGLGSVKA